MTDPTSSAWTSPDVIMDQLAQVRDAARKNAANSLYVAYDAERAIEAVQWGVDSGFLTDFPSVYSRCLNRSLNDLVDAGTATSSAHSNVQMAISGSTSGTVAGALVSEVFQPVLLRAPSFQRQSAQEKLDELLVWISGDARLGQRRRDAWLTVQMGTPESAAQACHSVREILTEILDNHASVAMVRSAPWWRPVPDAREGVSKRQKIRYLVVCADDEGIEPDVLDELANQVDRAMDAHNLTIKYAHHQEDDVVEPARIAMVDLEEVMLTLLTYRRNLGRC